MVVPLHKFSHVHVDLVGPWPRTVQGHTHLLTVVDQTTRWAEAIPLQSTTAQVVADYFVANWVACFGVPATLTTDQGTQFTGSTWQCMCRALGSKHVQPTAYHPQSNGMVERFHRQLKELLRARCSGADWLEHLPWVLLGLRAVPKEEVGLTAAKATYGHSLVLPSQLQPPPCAPQAAPAKVDIPSMVKPTIEAEKAREVGVQEASHVYVHIGAVPGPLDATYRSPYGMLVREKKKLLLEIGVTWTWVSMDRLKPHTAAAVPAVAQQPPPPPAKTVI